MANANSNLEQKAQLLEEGKIFIPNDINMPCFASRSTAGPDAGAASYAFEFNGLRVKLEVSKDPESRFSLSEEESGLAILEKGQAFIGSVKVLPTLAHAPNQAFINLDSQCRLECSFCSASALERGVGVEMNTERVLRIISIASTHPGFEGVAITSGVPDSTVETNKRIAEVVKGVRDNYPDLPIGVEAYFEELGDIDLMKDAGADEIKINVEAWPEPLFEATCPNRDRGIILQGIERALVVFGRGRVTSNIIIGLGEKDDEVEEAVRTLAKLGAIANIRRLRTNRYNAEPLKEALGRPPEGVSADRLIRLAQMHKKVLEEYDLSTLDFKTMCLSCQCCDIVPMRDL